MGLGDWLRRLRAGRGDDARDEFRDETAPDADRVAPAAGGSARDAGGECDGAVDQHDDGGEFDPFPEPVRLEITDTIDLHAFAPRDVRRVVEAYLEEARAAGFPSVRIIHGRGRYVQRAAVRAVLERTPFVRDFTDAPPERGGPGATVAHLKGNDE